MQETFKEVAECRRSADRCQKLSLNASEPQAEKLLRELAVLLATLADDLEGRLEPRAAAFVTTKQP